MQINKISEKKFSIRVGFESMTLFTLGATLPTNHWISWIDGFQAGFDNRTYNIPNQLNSPIGGKDRNHASVMCSVIKACIAEVIRSSIIVI
jgi:hypothetical protein